MLVLRVIERQGLVLSNPEAFEGLGANAHVLLFDIPELERAGIFIVLGALELL